ncbi:putative gustatory receptor 36b [Musca autumnalis]|uniref:putative gustatory receptor 36b n=1 Tax=Musca autumnalis TaxID=221902 RepID=UPI003CEAA23F
MRRSTHWMITVVLVTAQLLGTLSFCYNHRTGEIYIAPWLTYYTALISVAMFGVLPMLQHITVNTKYFHAKINFLIFLIRLTAVLVSVIFNWTKRGEYIKSLRDLYRLKIEFLKRWPLSTRLEEKFENAIRSKFCWGITSSMAAILGSFEFFKQQLNVNNVGIIVTLGLMANVINLVLTSYFCCILRINTLLAAINEELAGILEKSKQLANLRKLGFIHAGFFITQCCQFSDDVEELARFQLRFCKLAMHINDMYDVQGACVLLTVYLNSTSVFYAIYVSSNSHFRL